MFSAWRRHLDGRIDLRPLEYAGRGRRIMDTLYASLDDAVEDASRHIRRTLGEGGYALFGHSMGAIIAFKLAKVLMDRGYAAPEHVFLSGEASLDHPRNRQKRRHDLPDQEFKRELMALGGVSEDFFDNPELVELFIPIVRNDLRILEEYVHAPDDDPVDCGLTILLGQDDDIRPEEAQAWRACTRAECEIHYFEGGHFFVHDHLQAIAEIINRTLMPIASNR